MAKFMFVKISLMAEITDADALREAALKDFDTADMTSPDHPDTADWHASEEGREKRRQIATQDRDALNQFDVDPAKASGRGPLLPFPRPPVAHQLADMRRTSVVGSQARPFEQRCACSNRRPSASRPTVATSLAHMLAHQCRTRPGTEDALRGLPRPHRQRTGSVSELRQGKGRQQGSRASAAGTPRG